MTAPSRQAGLFEAIAIALILVVQTLGSAYATGAGAVPLDAFGNPLCITSGNHAAPTDGSHGGVQSCCALACTNVATLLVTPERGGAVEAPPRRLAATLSGVSSQAAPEPPLAASARPRAPPLPM